MLRNGQIEVPGIRRPDGGFSHQVPARLLLEAQPNARLDAGTSASLVGGGSLPSWLTYQSTTRTFTATEPPANALPFRAQINVTTTAGQVVAIPVLIAQP